MVNIDTQYSSVIQLDGCELKLIARDGVLIRGLTDTDIPRSVDKMFFSTSSRADIAIHCPGNSVGNASYEMYINGSYLAGIQVTGTQTTSSTSLTQFTPIRPNYLSESFVDYSGPYQQYPLPGRAPNGEAHTQTQDYFNFRVSGVDINGESFLGKNAFEANISINSVNEWRIENFEGIHPFHAHVNHFEMITIGAHGNDIPSGWFEIGDYYDTMYGSGTVRFRANTWGGRIVVHCHILRHEDEGSMTVFKVVGGCENDLINDFEFDEHIMDSTQRCNYNYTHTCDNKDKNTNSPTVLPTVLPTIEPTVEPTISPTLSPIIIEKKNGEDYYSLRLCLRDVSDGVTVTKVEIRDNGTGENGENATWVEGEQTNRGCFPWKYTNNEDRPWQLNFDVRITDDNDIVLTGYDIITDWQEGFYDFGQNFVCFLLF